MKKLLALTLVAGLFAVVSCGPSAEEKAKQEQAKKDSIEQVEKQKADETAAIEKAQQDSIAAIETAKQDSIKVAEEAKTNKKGGKPVVKKDATTKAVETQKSLKGK